jgi:charged multivesicular body protein 7
MSTALRAASRLRPATITTLRPVTRAFSQSQALKSGGSSYDPPSGWLFGVKPGEKYEKEGWEGPIYWGLCGSMVVAVIAYAFKPDTRYVW